MASNILSRLKRGFTTASKPLIAVTTDYVADEQSPTESRYSIRMNYCAALQNAGALPVVIPYDGLNIQQLVELFDGFVISGSLPGTLESPLRTQFELDLIKLAVGEGKAVLGICNGMQMMALAFGGQVQTIPVGIGEQDVDHLPYDVPDRIAHTIEFKSRNRLSKMADGSPVKVNSLHRQAISKIGNFQVLATALDNTIEAISLNTNSYAIGVQWHPEYSITDFDVGIVRDFVCVSKSLGQRYPTMSYIPRAL